MVFYKIPHGTKVEVRKTWEKEWRNHTTNRTLWFSRKERCDELGYMQFADYPWFIRVEESRVVMEK